MAGGTRYFRYIVIAFVALITILYLSGSSNATAREQFKTATDKLKSQSSNLLNNGLKKVPSLDDTSTVPDHTNTSPNPYLDSTPPHNVLSSGSGKPAAGPRMNATFVTLARNSDVWEISKSIRHVEDRFNRNYNYDWVFLNDKEFDDTFKKITTALTSGKARYGLIGKEHWGYPEFIDQDKAARVREDMRRRQIIYGDSESYRHMCRYESGLFFQHPLMLEYEWYWRVEPSVKLFCDVAYDPFAYMAKHGKKYSFTISLFEYAETIETLWDSVKKFIKKHPEHLAPNNAMDFISEDGGNKYNMCHFWSNFEIGNLNWLRGKAYTDYFNFLDREGGFFYERWGDAPVHSIAAALLLNKTEIHFFNDIAYYHVPFTHCPTGEQLRIDLKCSCDPGENFDWNGYSCKLPTIYIPSSTPCKFFTNHEQPPGTGRWFDINGMKRPEGYEKEN
jgi:alpha 1,2-mannosyltransferase